MNHPRIIVDDNIPFIRGRLEPVADVAYTDQFGFTPELVRDADALIIRTRTQCNRDLLEGSSVRLIATATIGMDQIDIPWCTGAGITVCNSPGCNAPGVAQYVWSSLLRGGFDPSRHTLGVVGCGHVGSIVAHWGSLMGCRVIVNDPLLEHSGDTSRHFLPLDSLLAQSDAVTLHTPLTKSGLYPTYHLIGERELGLMKPGAILVNAARGPVTDTLPLKRAIRDGHIRAVIDTWEGEPDIDTELLGLSEIGTFHIAGYSYEGKQRATRMVLEAVSDFFGIPVDVSDLAAPYTPHSFITPEMIISSYDPEADMRPLVANPSAFDTLRAHYNYRHEVSYVQKQILCSLGGSKPGCL